MGTRFWLRLMLYMYVRFVVVFGPKYFKCPMMMLSGPVKSLFLLFCIACFVPCSEIVTCVFPYLFLFFCPRLCCCVS